MSIFTYFFGGAAEWQDELLFFKGPKGPEKNEVPNDITQAIRPEADYGDEDPYHSIAADAHEAWTKLKSTPDTEKKVLDAFEREWARMRA